MLAAVMALPVALALVQAAPDAAGGASAGYTIGRDDILQVMVFGYEDLSQTVVVQPDGTFPFPLVKTVRADGLTVAEVQESLRDALGSGFIRSPQVAVVVKEFRSKRVFVVGEVARPGPYPLSGTTTLVELLARAGPLTANAGTELTLVRAGPGAQGPTVPLGPEAARGSSQVLRIDLRDLQSGDLSKNLVLEPNDTLFVPQSPKVFVSGEVRNPGAFPFSPGMTVRQLIGLAGGFSEDGSARGVRVIRPHERRAREKKIPLEDPVLPGDTIVVKPKLF